MDNSDRHIKNGAATTLYKELESISVNQICNTVQQLSAKGSSKKSFQFDVLNHDILHVIETKSCVW